MKKFKYSFDDNKRYHTWNYYLRQHFGQKVFKVSINAGFTCPNIDGKISHGGCIYCSKKGSGDFAGNPNENLIKQFYDIKTMMNKKWHNAKYIGYFQAFTNTYAPLDVLKEKYETIMNLEDVIGLSIATRPDCLPEDLLDYLEQLNKKTNLWIELGLQSIHDKTSKIINRGHDFECFKNAVSELKKRNIKVVVHIINGLPGETYEMMMETTKAISSMNIDGIKIHLLHVIKNTQLELKLKNNEFKLLDKDEYINLICDQLEILPPEMVIHRLTGDGKRDELIGPLWSLKKWEVLNSIDATLKDRDSWQGKKYKKI